MSENPAIFATFFSEPVHMPFLSEQEGRPVHEDRVHVRIVIAGDKHSEVVREATDADKARFHEPYARYERKASERDQIVGTPLTEAPFVTAALRRDLEHFNVFSVEQLAALGENVIGKLGMGARELVAKAKAFLELAKDTALATKQAAELERRDAEIADLKRQIAEIGKQVAAGKAGKA